MSRLHLRIDRPVPRSLTVDDLGSAGGTFLGEERVQRGARLADSMIVRIGGDALLYRDAVTEG